MNTTSDVTNLLSQLVVQPNFEVVGFKFAQFPLICTVGLYNLALACNHTYHVCRLPDIGRKRTRIVHTRCHLHVGETVRHKIHRNWSNRRVCTFVLQAH